MAGRKTQALGAVCEAAIEATFARVARAGLARVQRTKPPMKIVGKSSRPGVFMACMAGGDCVDYEGVWRGGLLCAFDVKHAARGERFDFGGVRDGQLRYLSELAAWGALAFLIVWREGDVGRADVTYVLPVDGAGRIAGVAHKRALAVATAGEAVRESVRWEDLDARGWRCAPGELWAECVERQRRCGAFGGV